MSGDIVSNSERGRELQAAQEAVASASEILIPQAETFLEDPTPRLFAPRVEVPLPETNLDDAIGNPAAVIDFGAKVGSKLTSLRQADIAGLNRAA